MSELAEKTGLKTFQCQKHGEYTGETMILKFPGMQGKEIDPACPACQKEAEEENRVQEEEARKSRVISKWRSMNIDKKFHESTLDNFNAYNNELKEHLETCRQFAKNPDGKLVMLGEHGNGKTHLAISVLKQLGGVIYTAYEIGMMLRQSYNNGDLNEWEIYKELCSVPCLVIDEVEKIKDSESKNNWMSHVIGKRYNRMLPIILIANCHTQSDCFEPKKPCPRCLEYHLENDVLSRIIEDGIVMKFKSGDYREKIREARFEARE